MSAFKALRGPRTRVALLALVLLAAFVAAACASGAASSATAPGKLESSASSALTAGPYVAVRGAHLVNAQGSTIRLLGVDRSGSEYECLGGAHPRESVGRPTSKVFDGPVTDAAVQAMSAWHINAVRVPLNEDCWLGINGISAAVAGVAYQNAITGYVHTLQSHGLIVILALVWAAPGSHLAASQWPMADADHARSFWESVAKVFASNHGVIFDLFGEPYISSWPCWLKGCSTSYDDAGTTVTYHTAGMQSLVSAVRSAGATQVLMLGGLRYASGESKWLNFKPADPDHQLAVSFHAYNFSGCNEALCWNSTIAPLAKDVPVISGEIGENGCTDAYIDEYMPWADAHGVSYLAWAWDSTGPPSGWQCSGGPALISDYDGKPTAYGAGFKKHLALLDPPP